MADDLDPKPQGNTGDPGTSGGSSDVDYEAKYVGLNKAHSKALDKLTKLQAKYDALQEEYEGKQAEGSAALKPLQDQLKDWEKKFADAEKEANRWKGEFETLKGAAALTAKLEAAWKDAPGLLAAWKEGDIVLKDRSTFEDDAKYDEYLARMASKVAPAGSETPPPPPSEPNLEDERRRFSLGATPPTPGGERGQRKMARTTQDIQKEMWDLDTSTAEGRRKFDELTRELDKALG